ncbi:MAG: type II toxin-antitoxin system RelE/ParE family toxin [Gemmatimonadetes bacterium]|nr:type II toxin-antitoxin system RelE/ParE family toxin [Gemmatimonadota bacterium]
MGVGSTGAPRGLPARGERRGGRRAGSGEGPRDRRPLRVRFLRPAEDEVLASLRYYASQSSELGAAFVEDLDHVVAILAAHPEAGAPFDVDKRRLLLRRFPHSVIYELSPDEVIVAAVPHQRQRPRSWKGSP